MKWKDLLANYAPTGLKLTTPFLELEFEPQEADKDAAWELYIELLTRITTQTLAEGSGDEETALASIYSIFGLTRDILKKYNRTCLEFSKIAIPVLNQVVRPFTAKWHRLSQQGAFKDPSQCQLFRTELRELQPQLIRYTSMLAQLADVEDLTELEPTQSSRPTT